MNSRILPSQVDEVEVGKFAADASELGWPPGHWPAHVDTTLGNGQRLVRASLTDVGAIYKQELGCIEVQVFND